MHRNFTLLAAASLIAVAGCAAPGGEIERAPDAISAEAQPAPEVWTYTAAAPAIRAASCEAGKEANSGLLPLDLSVRPLTQKQAEAVSEQLPDGAKVAGAWELSSTDPNFGGLSGLALESGSSLLAVTDAGGWVRLGLEDGAPASAQIGYLRGADGAFLSGKTEGDAEGLALRDGVAFVSFERDFRIEAFNIGRCGAAAKAVRIAGLPNAFDGTPIEENEGPEALSLTPDGMLVYGFETTATGKSPFGEVFASGMAGWSGAVAANPAGFALVGIDTVRLPDGTDRRLHLYRAFDPLRGARSVLTWGSDPNDRLTLSRPVLTDNFEGLAAEVREDGALRVWIVSDDNFSGMQRTLLYAFDVTL